MRKWMISALAAVCLLGALSAGARACDTPYLVLLEDAPLSLLSGDLTPVAPESGVYRTEDRAAAETLVDQGLASVCAPDCPVELLGSLTVPTPNDSGTSWHWQAIGADYPAAVGLTGAGVRIGLVDSGVCLDHPDLAGADIEPGWNYLRGDTDVSDHVGHGTFITGLLLARPNNGMGLSGLCPGATLVPLKAFSSTTGTLSDALAAVEGAWRDFDCDIIHMSFGILGTNLTASQREILQAAMAEAAEHALLVAAAGNSNGTAAYYPAACDDVIGVAAVSKDLTRWTSGGLGSQYNETVDLAAPGGSLTSLSLSGGMKTGSGTSYAAPLVSAAAALLLEREPELTGAAVTTRLTESAQDLGEPGRDDYFGAGLLRLDRLLMEVPVTKATEDGTYYVELPRGGSVVSARYAENGQFLGATVETLPPAAFGYYTPAPDTYLLDAASCPLTPAVGP